MCIFLFRTVMQHSLVLFHYKHISVDRANNFLFNKTCSYRVRVVQCAVLHIEKTHIMCMLNARFSHLFFCVRLKYDNCPSLDMI